MNLARAREFRRERSRELRGIADILLHRGLIRSADPLRQAAGACVRPELERQPKWSYVVDGLIFELADSHLRQLRHTEPADLIHLELELSVNLSGECHDDDDTLDPFQQLVVDCEVRGLCGSGEHVTAWHLDRHIGNEPSAFIHPMYHFQYGGNRLRELAEHGRHLLLEPPRLAHPPMDAVLAVDFILSNYFAGEWVALRETEPSYTAIVRDAQSRFWRPYALAAAHFWAPLPATCAWPAEDVWPHLV